MIIIFNKTPEALQEKTGETWDCQETNVRHDKLYKNLFVNKTN